jgi:transposase
MGDSLHIEEITHGEGLPTTLPGEIELPSATPHEALAAAQHKHQELELRWKQHCEEAAAIVAEHQKVINQEKALEWYVKVFDPQPEETKPPPPRTKRQPIADQVRALVAEKVLSGQMTPSNTAKVFNISATSVSQIVQAVHNEWQRQELAILPHPGENIQPPPTKKRRGPKPKLNADDVMGLLDLLEERPELRLKDLVACIAKDFHKNVSKLVVDRVLRTVDITYKESLTIPSKWNTDAVKQLRHHWVSSRLQQFLGRPLVFVDEMPSNLHVRPTHGRAPAGQPAKITVVPKGSNVTLIAALSRSGIIHHKFVLSLAKGKRGTNADDFRIFLADLRRRLPARALVVLDNAAIHHTEGVEADLQGLVVGASLLCSWINIMLTSVLYLYLQELGFAFLFLPPYSPFMNPIEYAFSKIKKALVHKSFSNQQELQAAIIEVLQTITPADAVAWSEHVIKYYPMCFYGLPFIGKPLAPELASDLPSVEDRLQFEWRSFLGMPLSSTTALIEGPPAMQR